MELEVADDSVHRNVDDSNSESHALDITIIIPSSGVLNCVEFENGPGPTSVSA